MGSKGKLSLIATLFLLISFLSASSSSKTIQKVSVDLYYETLCPDSVEFIVNDLVKLFKYGFVPFINLNLVPYGNAKLRSNNSIVCQSGLASSSPFFGLTQNRIRASRIKILPSDSEKVSLGLYYESLCPYSANFIVNYLVNLFEDDLISFVDLNLVPWGNAKIRGNNSVACQHGPYECLLNTVEACAINIWPDLSVHFPFIYCIEALVYERNYTHWESCFEKLGLDPKPITDCYTGEYGKELELQYAAETNALQPPHQYVPWVVVDGQPLYEEYEDFLSYICKAYKGIVVPESCAKLSLDTIKMKGAQPRHPVT